MDEMRNLCELMDFLQKNQERTLGGTQLKQYAFRALVTYFHSSKTTTFETEVRVDTGFQNGRVSMQENGQCSSDKFHLDFEPKYQTMDFDRESNVLIIRGDSNKIGPYKVTMAALGSID